MENSNWKGLILLLTVVFISCNKDDHEQPTIFEEVSFTLDAGTVNARVEDANLVNALISIEDEEGNVVMSLEELKLVELGDGIVTEKIQLAVGRYTVTEFLVVNGSNEAVYVAPMEGSEMAAYVENPLPVPFQVGLTTQESVSIEVLEIALGANPIDFGLVDFPVDFAELFPVELSLIKNNLPVEGQVTVEGFKNGSLLWLKRLDVEGSASIHLYSNADTIFIEALYADMSIERSYTIDQLRTDSEVLFNFSEVQNFVIEVVGLEREVDYAIGRLSNENEFHKIHFEIDETQNLLVGNFQNVKPGSYALTISVFEGKNLIEYPEARGSLYQGVESHELIEIVLNQPRIVVQGPDVASDESNYEPEWSERYFYTFLDREVFDTDIPWSTPEQPCEFNLRILPEALNVHAKFAYIDYFIHSEEHGSTSLGYDECVDCDPLVHVQSFFEQLAEDGSVGLCETKDWDIADSVMILNFGSEDIYFFMRWDTEGVYLDLLDSNEPSIREIKSSRAFGVNGNR